MNTIRTIRFRAALLLFAVLLAMAPAASAQCAMCANAAASQQADARKALNLGIATLVAPVFLLIGGFVFLSYRRRNAPDDPSGALPDLAEPAPSQTPVVNLPLDESSDCPRPSA
jgi:heme/copper-type cytochrome/quinol oxidase subunit 2